MGPYCCWNRSIGSWILLGALCTLTACQTNADKAVEESATKEVSEFLPLDAMGLEDMSSFKTDGDNWSICGGVRSDFTKEWDLSTDRGSGVLVNTVEDAGIRDGAGKGSHLLSTFEHGDMELELEFLVPKASNSGIYFMGRYELQIRDSYDDDTLSADDCGGIYFSWKDPGVRKEAIGGHIPASRAERHPGLWQTYKVLFRAPRFDENGGKTENARFEYVYLNGFLIHEDVEVASPTIEALADDEVPVAPLMIQGDHGPVAFRNIRTKMIGNQRVQVQNLTYELYKGEWDYIPSFEDLEPESSGTAESLDDLESLAGVPDHFGFVFEGELLIPISGEYLFETIIDDGGNLYVDGQLVVHNEGEPGLGIERGLVRLEAGSHKMKLTFFEEIWLALANLKVEGPGIPKHSLASVDMLKQWREGGADRRMVEDVGSSVEMIRGFVHHKDQKLTHTVSVGDPAGMHYSYDVRNYCLVKAWKGMFADVTQMWLGRGEQQALQPRNAAIELDLTASIARLSSAKSIWPKASSKDEGGFRLDEQGRPIFFYEISGIGVTDHLYPNGKALRRVINLSAGADVKNMWYKIGSADKIERMDNNHYTVGNLYFINLGDLTDKAVVRSADGQQELIIPVLKNSNTETLSYDIVW